MSIKRRLLPNLTEEDINADVAELSRDPEEGMKRAVSFSEELYQTQPEWLATIAKISEDLISSFADSKPKGTVVTASEVLLLLDGAMFYLAQKISRQYQAESFEEVLRRGVSSEPIN